VVPDQQELVAVAHPQREVMDITGVLAAEAVEATLEQAPQELGERELMVTIGMMGGVWLEQEEVVVGQEAVPTLIRWARVVMEGYMGAVELLLE
jgi:hypothetical protein